MTSTSRGANWRHARTGFALLVSLIFPGTTIVVGDSQIAAERLALGATLAFHDDATPKEGELDADPKSDGIELAPGDADKALDTMRVAAHSAGEGVRSVIAKARFTNWLREPDEKESQLITAGRLELYSADGKYHLKFTHEKMLRRTINLPQGVFPSKKPGEADVFRNEAGEVVDVPAKLVDWKADNVFIVNDGRSITSTVVSPRLRPNGVRSESHINFQDASGREVGVRFVDPAHLVGGVGELEAVIKNLGREAIQITGLPNGGFRATYRVKNAPQVRVELDAFAKDGFNVSASRVFNDGQQLPASAEEATWKKVNDKWLVSKVSCENRYRGAKHLAYRKEVVIYYSLEVNPWVDPKAFTTGSMSDDWQPRASADDSSTAHP
jgi:hypothetical protein